MEGNEANTTRGKYLPPITIEQMDAVLTKNISPHEALGPDHWHLPKKARQGLTDTLHRAEEKGKWPKGMGKTTVALVVKGNATHRGQLRP